MRFYPSEAPRGMFPGPPQGSCAPCAEEEEVLLLIVECSRKVRQLCGFPVLPGRMPGDVLSFLSADELISPKDIDPIRRHVPLQDRRNVSMRFSNQVGVLCARRPSPTGP